MEADYSSDELLDRYPFSPLGVADHPKNCIPPDIGGNDSFSWSCGRHEPDTQR